MSDNYSGRRDLLESGGLPVSPVSLATATPVRDPELDHVDEKTL